MPLLNALPPFNIISNFAKNISKPKELIQSNIQSSKESAKIAGISAGLVAGGLLAPKVAPLLKSGAGKVGSQAGKYALEHPLKSLGLIGAGIVGASAIRENPKIASQAPKATIGALSDLGQTIGKTSKSTSFGEAFGHLRDYTQEHPVASIGGALVAGGLLGKAIFPAIATTQQTRAIKEQTAAIEAATVSGLGSGGFTQNMPALASPSYIEPTTTTTSWGQSSGTKAITKRRKPKNINRSPVNVRNQIVIANRNG